MYLSKRHLKQSLQVKPYFHVFLIGLLFLLPFVIKDRDFKVDTRQWKFLILRNAAGVSSMLINFYVVKFLPLSIAVLLMNTSALFIPILLLFSIKKHRLMYFCVA